jgi:hypothetical protein
MIADLRVAERAAVEAIAAEQATEANQAEAFRVERVRQAALSLEDSSKAVDLAFAGLVAALKLRAERVLNLKKELGPDTSHPLHPRFHDKDVVTRAAYHAGLRDYMNLPHVSAHHHGPIGKADVALLTHHLGKGVKETAA